MEVPIRMKWGEERRFKPDGILQYQVYTVNTNVLLLVFIWATGFGLGSDHHSGPLHLKFI